MGPLSVKMQIQEDQAVIKEQREILKMLNAEGRKDRLQKIDEEQKKKLHELKLANELAKARQNELPIEKAIQDVRRDASTAPLGSGMASEARGHLMNRGQRLQQEESRAVGYNNGTPGAIHPSDTVPAMLTPGEAVIPAPAAQHPAYKPIIKQMVQHGRQMNNGAPLTNPSAYMPRREAGVPGYNDGITGVPFFGGSYGDVVDDISEEEFERLRKIPISELTAADAAKIAQITSFAEKMAKRDVTAPAANEKTTEATIKQQVSKLMGDDSEDYYRRDSNIKEIESELGKTRDPKAKKILMDELERLRGINPAEPADPAARVGNTKRIAELQKAIAKSTDMAETNRLSAELDSLQGTNTFSVPKPEKFISEEATLRKLIENPGTDANTRGQARLKLEKLRGGNPAAAAEVPKMTREYGTAKALPGDVVTDPTIRVGTEKGRASMADVPKPSQPVPTRAAADMFVGPAAVDESLGKDNGAQHVAMMDNLLNDPKIQTQLEVAKNDPVAQSLPPAEQKSWLAEQLSKIFGDSGMFNSEELITFGILAAGGLLTGGSTGGSLRYAGLHTLKQSQERRNSERNAAAVANQKLNDTRTNLLTGQFKDHQQLLKERETQYNKLLEKISPKGYREAAVYFQKYLDKGLPAADREMALRQATHIAATSQVDDKTDKEPKILPGKHFRTGKDMDVMQVGNIRMVSPAGANKWVPETATDRALDVSQYNAVRKEQMDDVEKVLKNTLVDINTKKGRNGGVYNKDFGPAQAEIKANGLARELIGILDEIGHDANPKMLATAAEITMQNLHEQFGGDVTAVSAEALRKTMFGTALVVMRPTSKALYKPETPVNEKSENILSAQAYELLASKAIEVSDLTKGEKTPLDRAQAMQVIEDTYKRTIKENPKLEGVYKREALGNPGQSAFTVWLGKHFKPSQQ